MDIQERAKFLLAVVDTLITQHTAWVDDGDAHLITEEFQTSVVESIEVFASGDVPANCRQLEQAILKMSEHWLIWANTVTTTGNENLLPSNAFWRSMETIVSARSRAMPRQLRKLETIQTLDKQKVPDRQICKMYGWEGDDGEPTAAHLGMLDEERENPGKHTEDMVHPLETKRLAEVARQQQIFDRVRKRRENKISSITTPAPESWEELFRQQLSAKQIATMKRCTVETVYAKATELGLPKPSLEYNDVRTQQGIHNTPNESAQRMADGGRETPELLDGQDSPSEMDEAPESDELQPIALEDGNMLPSAISVDDEGDEEIGGPLSQEQEVVMYFQQGMAPGIIAEEVSTENNKISRQKVNSIIKQFKDNPQRFLVA